MGKVLQIYCGGDYDHVMLKWPNGSIEFLDSFWSVMSVMWHVIRSGGDVEIVDRDKQP